MKPTDEQIQQGWTQNSRGGWQPPDDQIDLTDIPDSSGYPIVAVGLPAALKYVRERR